MRCHRPTGLAAAVTLAEDHLALYPRSQSQQQQQAPGSVAAGFDPQRAPQTPGPRWGRWFMLSAAHLRSRPGRSVLYSDRCVGQKAGGCFDPAGGGSRPPRAVH
ncbi:uncharacterized protein LOC118232227 isoform X2 [Anguilla anguilla]|uniref:uncharacterized protein LOC118232227 isoform X2 n=1 Tax=Anguilla anguilla TaxID=7936 RepID=UPI0015AC8441|nr:uncharacterized protein LOC118232227 isoform X2 [Anguilla anguilla]